MYYRHELDIQYPERCDEHMITVKRTQNVKLDENYPYLQSGFWFGCKRVLLQFLMHCILPLVLPFSHGLKIYGRENLKKHKELLKGGVITISNHVFMWDFICVMRAMRPRQGFFPVWKTNMEGSNGPLIRMAGGIPVPTDSFAAMKKYKRAMETVLERGEWVHFYPEGSLWFFYPDLRPLKKAVFGHAVKYDRPLVPITMSFRPRTGISRLFTKNPMVDLHIGEPMFADKTLSPVEATKKLQKEAYHVMQGMMGIHPGDPTYSTNLDLSTYQKTMG